MEALVAHHVIYNQSCFHCKRLGGLRWHGGRDNDSSWTDLLCCKCNSTYEVKSKKDQATVDKTFRKFSRFGQLLPGGSFRKFHTNHLGSAHGKRFVLLVSRVPDRDKQFKVFVSEIVSVDPSLDGKSFATYTAKRSLFLGSKVTMKQVNRLWCSFNCPPNLAFKAKAWAIEVYEEKFGDGSWGAEAAAVAVEEDTRQEVVAEPEPDPVASLTAAFSQVEIPDDWDSSGDEAN